MTHIAQGATGAILTHYTSVIEGSASLRGVPGSASANPILRDGLTLTASSGTTSTATISSPATAVQDEEWVRTMAPPYFLLSLTGGNADAARRITGWSSPAFTVAPAFASAVSNGDTFTILEGFRRVPNDFDWDLNEEGSGAGWDRRFQLSMLPGEVHQYYGKGLRSYRSTLTIRLRLLKYGRENDTKSAVLENLRILTDAVTDRNNIEPTYVRMMDPEGTAQTIEQEDRQKVVASVAIPLTYRVQTAYN